MKAMAEIDDAVKDFRGLIGLYDEQPLFAGFCMESLEKIIELSGIKLFRFSENPKGMPLPKCFGKDGAAGYSGSTKFIALNDLSNIAGRSLFTLLHEYGHFALNHFRIFEYIPHGLSSDNYQGLYQDLENEANAFASRVLMPEMAIRKFINDNKRVLAKHEHYNGKIIDSAGLGGMMNHFETTWSAVMHRLDDLGIQAKPLSQALLDTYDHRKLLKKDDYKSETDKIISAFSNEIDSYQGFPVKYHSEFVL